MHGGKYPGKQMALGARGGAGAATPAGKCQPLPGITPLEIRRLRRGVQAVVRPSGGSGKWCACTTLSTRYRTGGHCRTPWEGGRRSSGLLGDPAAAVRPSGRAAPPAARLEARLPAWPVRVHGNTRQGHPTTLAVLGAWVAGMPPAAECVDGKCVAASRDRTSNDATSWLHLKRLRRSPRSLGCGQLPRSLVPATPHCPTPSGLCNHRPGQLQTQEPASRAARGGGSGRPGQGRVHDGGPYHKLAGRLRRAAAPPSVPW